MRGLLASPLGFLIGLSLGALGGGGSILAVPVLVYAAGLDAQEATASSLVLVGTAALVGMHAHWRAGRVRVATGVAFGIAGVPGSLLGSALNARMNGDVLLLCFSGLILVAAWRMVTGCPSCTRVGEAHAMAAGGTETRTRVDARRVLEVIAVGSGVGFLTGLFGVGGGFVIVPALTLVLGLAMPEAIGTSLLVIALNAATALVPRVADAQINWAVTLPFTLSAIAGVLVGTRIADRLDPKRSLRYFAALLVGVACYTAISSVVALTG